MALFSNTSDITDPSDFSRCSLPRLAGLDSLLRCHICKEFLTAPMLTSCGHSFCSVCIRKYLIHTPKCPICSKEIRESNVQRNVLLEQVVMSFKDVRQGLLEKLDTKTVRKVSQSFTSSSSSGNTIRQHEVIDIDDVDDDVDDDVSIVSETKKRRHEPQGLEALFKKRKSPEVKESPVAACPICSKNFPLDKLESEHIDLCLSAPLLIDVPSEPLFSPKEPDVVYQKLTKLDYSSMSNSALKQKLMKLDLPTTGTRSQMEQRYNEYLIVWNANCDSVAPKNPKVLRKQVAQWEASLKFKNGEVKQLDKEGWKELIEQARSGLKKAQPQDYNDIHDKDTKKENKMEGEVDTILIMSSNEDIKTTQGSGERFFQD